METLETKIDAPESALYALDWSHVNAEFSYNDGTVTHRLRRPERQVRDGNDYVNEAVKFFAFTPSETLVKNGARRTPLQSEDPAYNWLYGRLIQDATGFEMPFGAGFCDELDVSYKKQALNTAINYRVEIQHEKTRKTMKGGTYVVRAWRGVEGAESLVGDFTFDFWSEKVKTTFEGSVSTVERQKGDTRIEFVDVSFFEYLKIFDACVKSATGCGVTENNIVRFASVDELREHTDDFLKLRFAVELVKHWKAVAGK